jgi:hypothetical protein
MLRLTLVILFALIFVVSTAARDLPVSEQPATRWILDFETGSESGLGYKLPHIAVGTTVERAVGKRLEVQGELFYSPDKKYITNDGNSIKMASTLIVWVTPRIGITSEVSKTYLWTSQFSKSELHPAFGVVIRDHFEGAPGRLYLSYLLPTGCQWGLTCPIQSNRLQGPQGSWEHRISTRLRYGFSMGIYRILNQSNPLQPSIPRTREWSGDTHLFVRFEFHPGSMDLAY